MCLTPRNYYYYSCTDTEHLAHYLRAHPCLIRVGAPNSRVNAVLHPASGLRITITLDEDDVLHCVISGGYGATATQSTLVGLTLADGTKVAGTMKAVCGRRILHFKFSPTRAGETALLRVACEAVDATVHAHSVCMLESARVMRKKADTACLVDGY